MKLVAKLYSTDIQPFLNESSNSELALEGFSLVERFTDLGQGFSTLFKTHQLLPTAIQLSFFSKNAILANIDPGLLEGYQVFVPEALNIQFLPFLDLVTIAANQLTKINERLLMPLNGWASSVLNEADFIDKIWVTSFGEFVNVNALIKQLRVCYNDGLGDNSKGVTFYKAYRTTDDVLKVTNALAPLIKYSAAVLDGSINEQVNRTTNLLKAVAKANFLQDVPPAKLKPITNAIIQAAKEVELLSIILFQIKTASWSHEKNLEKIKREIK